MQALWQARASADTLFAFISVLPEGAFCEGGLSREFHIRVYPHRLAAFV